MKKLFRNRDFLKMLFWVLVCITLLGTAVCLGIRHNVETKAEIVTEVSEPTAEPEIPTTFYVDGHPIEDCKPTYATVRLEDGEFDVREVPVVKLEDGSYQGMAEPRDYNSQPVFSAREDTYARWMVYKLNPNAKVPELDRWENPWIGTITLQKNVFELLNSSQFSEAVVYNKNGVIAHFRLVSHDDPAKNAQFGWEKDFGDAFCVDPKVNFTWTEDFSTLKPLTQTQISFPRNVLDLGKAWFYTGKYVSAEELYSLKFHMQTKRAGIQWSGVGYIGQGSATHGGYEAKIRIPATFTTESYEYEYADRVRSRNVDLYWCLPGWREFEEERYPNGFRCETLNLGIQIPLNTEIFVYSKWHGWQRFIFTTDSWHYQGRWSNYQPIMLEGTSDEHPWDGFDFIPGK